MDMDIEEIKYVIGQRLRHYRKIRFITQRELAAEIGVVPSYIADIERGQKGISIEKIVELCMWFNISVSDLIPLERRTKSKEKEYRIRNITDSLEGWEVERIKFLEALIANG